MSQGIVEIRISGNAKAIEEICDFLRILQFWEIAHH
jgi:hypothetical protein